MVDNRSGGLGTIGWDMIAKARPDVKERLVGAGAQPVGSTPEEMATFLKSEFARWSKVIKTVGIRLN